MKAIADIIIVELVAKTDNYRRDMDRAASETQERAAEVEKSVSGLSGMASSVMEKLGVSATDLAKMALQAFADMVKSGIDYTVTLGKVSEQIGISTTRLQELRYAAGQFGVDGAALDSALQGLSKTIGEASTGSAEHQKIFSALGLSYKDAQGNIKDTGAMMPEIADALSRVTNVAQRNMIGTKLFGDAWKDVAPMLAGGSAKINALSGAAHELGLVISPEHIKDMSEAEQKYNALKTVMSAQIAGIVARNADSILALVETLSAFIDMVGKAIQGYRNFKNTLAGKVVMNLPLLALPGVGPAMGLWKYATGNKTKQAGWATRGSEAGETIAGFSPGIDLSGLNAKDGGGAAPRSFGGGAVPRNLGGGGGFGGGESAKNQRLRDEEEFASKIRSMEMTILGLLEESAKTEDERLALKLQQIELERQEFEAGIALNVKLKEMDGKEAEALTIRNQTITDMKKEAAIRASNAAKAKEQKEAEAKDKARADLVRKAQQEYDDVMLQSKIDEAKNRKERFALEKERIDILADRQIADAQAAADDKDANEADKKARADALKLQIDRIEFLRAQQTKEAEEKSEKSPLQIYFDGLDMTPEEMNDQFENIAVKGLQQLNDGLVDAIMNSKSLGDMFGKIAKQILADLVRIAVQQMIIMPLLEALGMKGKGTDGGIANGGGSGASGFLKALGNLFGGIFGGLFGKGGKATGGPAIGMTLVGENGPEIVNFGGRPNWVTAAQNIPKLSAAGGGQGVSGVIRVELAGDIDARIVSVSGPVAVQVTRAASGQIIEGAVNETIRRANRPRM